MRKKVFALMMSVCFIGMSIVPSSALNYSSYCHSGAATAGTWKTESSASVNYSSSLPHICGGDVGTYFYFYSVGLPSSFDYTTGRYAFFEIYENDVLHADVFARSYQATFSVNNGYYRPTTFIVTATSKDKIEDDGAAELYMKWFVYTMPGDTSTAIPANLLYYRYWAN